MAIQKQAINIPFIQGLDTKTDEFQVSTGKFLSLQNSVFTTGGQLTKRNGYAPLRSLPDDTSTFVTTFNGDLTAIGNKLEAYSYGSKIWSDKGNIQPAILSVLPLIRNNINQLQADAAISSTNLVCTAYTETNGVSIDYKYVVADSVTGQNIIEPTLIPANGGGTITGSPRVFLLGNYFILMFTNDIGGAYHLQYIAISIANPNVQTAATDISTSITNSSTVAWDAALNPNGNLYIAYNTTSGGQAIKVTYLTPTLVLPLASTFSGQIATMMSVTVDTTIAINPVIWVTYYDSASMTGHTLAVNTILNTLLAPTQVITGIVVLNLATTAQNAVLNLVYEVANNYGYDSTIPTHYLNTLTVTQSGTVGATTVLLRSVGLASKAFILAGKSYMLTAYQSLYQPTYFLIDNVGNVIAKVAYENGGGYCTLGLPSVTLIETTASIPYLYKDLIQAVNKNTNVPSGSQVDGVYSQTGINLVNINITTSGLSVSEMGTNLNLSGGFLWGYDGYTPTEQNFFLWPDSIEATASTTGGLMAAQQYYYQVTYEWTDNQGNAFRSAPSIPITVTTTSATSSVTLDIPTVRLTYKIANPIKLVVYRWSAAQQIYYQVTSIAVPLLNNPNVDYLTFTDTLADATILGNNIIYTTGGVVENIGPPACTVLTLFDDRLWLCDAEDQNLLWYSKQVIEATPVEMSDLFTVYIAPSISAQGSTGPITALSAMDDKLIIFKKDAIYYMNGSGPDNTGANSTYSQPTFITASVGCTNQYSIVLTPQGLMFQSDKGIWLLGRDLGTTYIGAPVEAFNGDVVNSSLTVPGTNQVRFTLASGQTLMYDYYYQQWGTFINVPAISSTLYQSLHTYINSAGQVFQESQGTYVDGSNPVLMSFTTNWMNLAGIQGYERFYYMLLLGKYITPFKLNCQLAYNYNPSPVQSTLVSPDNQAKPWGGEAFWGSNKSWGGTQGQGQESTANVFEARLFPQVQKCESFQISINEVYDRTYGIPAGEGLTLSGMNLVIGSKKGFRTSRAGRSFG